MNSTVRILVVIVTASIAAFAHQSSESRSSDSELQLSQAVRQLQEEITRLQSSVADLRSEADRYRAQTQELEKRLEALAANHAASGSSAVSAETPSAQGGASPVPDANSVAGRLSKIEDEYSLLTAKVDDQYQTKVESGSKYRVRFSGLVMLNLFANRGVPDSIDSPATVNSTGFYGNGSFAGTLRQSQLGVEVFGPEWAGAKTTGDLRFDFAGGFPNTEDGVTFGLMRLRTGNIRLNWSQTTLIAGQDTPMFSPLSPTSVIALAQPEFAYAGNLWNWVPQLQVQHWEPIGRSQRLTVAAGILDPLTGEVPPLQFPRAAQAGEASRQPGYSARIGWSDLSNEDRPTTVSVGGYFSRQNWGFNRDVDGWALTGNWEIPLPWRLSVKGEFYRGNAIGGFGASEGESVITSDVLENRFATVRGLNAIGGWTQAGFRASSTLQFNAGYGLDNPFSNQLGKLSPVQYSLYSGLGINRLAMANLIYRPRSDLLFSVEYRRFMTSRPTSQAASADNIGMVIGLLF